MIVIPMYHRVREPDPQDPKPGLCVPPQILDEQLQYLRRHGYRFTTFAELQQVGPRHKCVIVTFDDGTEDNYLHAFPILRRHGVSATVFVVAGMLGQLNAYPGSELDGSHRILTAEQIAEMAEAGIEIGSHTCTHHSLPSLSDAELEKELVESRRLLEAIVHRPLAALAYPYGHYDERVKSAGARAGYQFACTIDRGRNPDLSEPLALRRIPMTTAVRGVRLGYRLSFWFELSRSVHRWRRRYVTRRIQRRAR